MFKDCKILEIRSNITSSVYKYNNETDEFHIEENVGYTLGDMLYSYNSVSNGYYSIIKILKENNDIIETGSKINIRDSKGIYTVKSIDLSVVFNDRLYIEIIETPHLTPYIDLIELIKDNNIEMKKEKTYKESVIKKVLLVCLDEPEALQILKDIENFSEDNKSEVIPVNNTINKEQEIYLILNHRDFDFTKCIELINSYYGYYKGYMTKGNICYLKIDKDFNKKPVIQSAILDNNNIRFISTSKELEELLKTYRSNQVEKEDIDLKFQNNFGEKNINDFFYNPRGSSIKITEINSNSKLENFNPDKILPYFFDDEDEF